MKTAEQADHGGPAFPIHPKMPEALGCMPSVSDAGMSLRDYFAAKAMAAYIASQVDMTANDVSEFAEEVVARIAYQFADAMLAARKTA